MASGAQQGAVGQAAPPPRHVQKMGTQAPTRGKFWRVREEVRRVPIVIAVFGAYCLLLIALRLFYFGAEQGARPQAVDSASQGITWPAGSPMAATRTSTTAASSGASAAAGGPSEVDIGTTTATTTVLNRCYAFYSQMDVNPLQKYPDNPDSSAFGFATCNLCTGGALACTSLLHNGKTRIIAAHIHHGGDGADGGETPEGHPVINFCGDNKRGELGDGTPYQHECAQWDSNGASHNVDMEGVLVAKTNVGTTVAQRVEDIAAHPHRYYFNFHTTASWNYWYPTPHGISRGPLVLQRGVW